VGVELGFDDGIVLGSKDGKELGVEDGKILGITVGLKLGSEVGKVIMDGSDKGTTAEKTLTCPASSPLPSLKWAPIANTDPSFDRDTD